MAAAAAANNGDRFVVLNERVKLRTACDHCTASKVRCDGGSPCSRCVRTQSECYYRPVKRPAPSRRADKPDSEKKSARTTPPALDVVNNDSDVLRTVSKMGNNNMGPQHLDEHERRSWVTFFSMYKKFGKGCSAYWFKMQLSKMVQFLQNQGNEAALERLLGWMEALGIVVEDVDQLCKLPPHLQTSLERTPQPTVHRSADELTAEAQAKNMPLVFVSQNGVNNTVEVNPAFEKAFGCSSVDLHKMLQKAGGGFLPFSGDVMARVLSREADLLTYIQIVALSFDALGKPEVFPASRSFPTSHVFRVVKADGSEAWAVIKCVHFQYINPTKEFHSTFLASFDLKAPEVPPSAPVTAVKVAAALEDEKIDDALPYISAKDLAGDDETWLENLLTWVDDESTPDSAKDSEPAEAGKPKPGFDLEMLDLPLADDSFFQQQQQQ